MSTGWKLAIVGFVVTVIVAAGLQDEKATNGRKAANPAVGQQARAAVSGNPDVSSARLASITKAFSAELHSLEAECKQDIADLGSATSDIGVPGAVIAGYAAARVATTSCNAAARSIEALSVPSEFSGELADRADKTISLCKEAAVGKGQAAERTGLVLDGDRKPSSLLAMQDATALAGKLALGCAASIAAIELRGGVQPTFQN
jgi:hypothetical protein